MKPIEQLLFELCKLDIKLWFDGEHLHCNAPKGKLTPDLKADLSQRKTEIIAFLRRTNNSCESKIQYIPRNRKLPLSFAQQRLWFLSQLEQESVAYNVPAAINIKGQLNRSILTQSINEIIRRHEVLRTNFIEHDGEPLQVIHHFDTWEMNTINLQKLSPAKLETEIQRLAIAEFENPFDLTTDQLIRGTLLITSDSEHTLLLTLHHIVFDGWSLGVFIKET